VFPFEMMEDLIERVQVIALAHCPCRVAAQLLGKRRCNHELEACIKYDELADYFVIINLTQGKVGDRIRICGKLLLTGSLPSLVIGVFS